jgi:hypothetical protein
LPVPEALVFEADEFRFTMAAVAPFALLRDPPAHYRVHEGNLFWERAPAKQEHGAKRKCLRSWQWPCAVGWTGTSAPEQARSRYRVSPKRMRQIDRPSRPHLEALARRFQDALQKYFAPAFPAGRPAFLLL